uniref:Thyroid adenoma-associated protein homolog n=1 Tax=Schistocephalus solidus TaxID=70667 RepID=A0A0X3NJK4_SCHSO
MMSYVLIDTTYRTRDPLQDLLIALSCQVWCNRLRKCARTDCIGSARLTLVKAAPVYDFIFLHQSDPVDALRNSIMITFEGLLEFHIATCKDCLQDFCASLTTVLRRIVSQPLWQRNTLLLLTRLFTAVFRCRPTISMESVHAWLLSSDFRFARVMNTEVFSTPSLRHTFSLACLLINCARDIVMAQAAGELYALIAGKLTSSDAVQKDHLDAWISALVFVSSQASVDGGLAFFRPFLDKVFNLTPKVAILILEKDSEEFSANGLSVLLHCYRFRLSKKGPRHSSDQFLIRHRDRLYLAYQSQDPLLRLEALGVVEMKLCSSTLKDFDILDLFADLVELSISTIPLNLRNRLAHSLHRVSARLVETVARASNGRPEKCTQPGELREKCEGFFMRLFDVFLRSLHADSVPDVLANSLACLRSLVETLSSCPASVNWLQPVSLLTRLTPSPGDRPVSDHLATVASKLFLGMWSRLTDNRENAMVTILSTKLLNATPTETIISLWTTTLSQLLCSPRPNVNVVAPHMLRLLLHASPPLSTPADYGLNPARLLTLPTPLRTFWTMHYLLDRLESQTEVAESSSTTLTGGKYSDGLLVVSVSGPFYALLGAFRSLLEVDRIVSQEGKPETSASVKLPLCCTEMRMPVEWLFQNPEETSLTLDRRNICDRFLALVPRIAALCAAVVFHTSPEGVLVAPNNFGEFVTLVADKAVAATSAGLTTPHQTTSDPKLKGSTTRSSTPLSSVDWDACVRRVMSEPEYLVVCCWRTVRELSAILGGSLIRCGWHLSRSRSEKASASQWLTVKRLQDIADFFISQLMRSRHPGAFELTASGFENFCDILLSLPKLEVEKWPERWLSIMVADLTGVEVPPPGVCPKPTSADSLESSVDSDTVLLRYLCDTSSRVYCATRRSAGLPFFVQTLLVVLQKTRKASNLLSTVISALLTAVNCHSESTIHKPDMLSSSATLSAAERRLHATNVLRFLVRDATVGPHLSDHLEEILKCAIQGLNSSLWMIRNSSLMLYSTMMERIFGVNRTRDCDSKKNRMSSSVFFAKFPGMRAFLLQSFEESLRGGRSPTIGRTKLFALLNLLTRFLPPVQSATSDGTIVHAFLPYVFACAGSADIRIRLLAARSLTCLLQPACLPTLALRILILVTTQLRRSSEARSMSHNRLHGLLLQLLEILRSEYWPKLGTADTALADDANNGILPHQNCSLLQEVDGQLNDLLLLLSADSTNATLCPLLRQTGFACLLAAHPKSRLEAPEILRVARCLLQPELLTPSSPASLDVAATGLLTLIFNLQEGSEYFRSALLSMLDTSSSTLELQRILLGCLLLSLLPTPVQGVGFIRRDRLLWYEEIIFTLDTLLAPAPAALSSLPQTSGGASRQVGTLIDQLSRILMRQGRPDTTTAYYASLALAVFAVSSGSELVHSDSLVRVVLSYSADREKALTPAILPSHLSPLLVLEAVQFCRHSRKDGDFSSCDNLFRRLAVHLDPCCRTETKTHTVALAAASNALLANADSILDCQSSELLALFFALLSLIVSDAEDEIRFLTARVLRNLLEACRFPVNLPRDPLPITILPHFIDFLLQHWSRSAVSSLLEWLHKAVVEMWIQSPEGSAVRLFVPESTGLSIGPADLSRQVRRALTEWTAAVPDKNRVEWLAPQIGSFVRRLRQHSSDYESVVSSDGRAAADIASDFEYFSDFLQCCSSQSWTDKRSLV